MRGLFFTILLTFLCGCASQPPHSETSSPIATGATLRPGDCLSIQITKQSVLQRRELIDADGDISLPSIDKLHVAGMTVEQVEQAILAAYQVRLEKVSVSKCP